MPSGADPEERPGCERTQSAADSEAAAPGEPPVTGERLIPEAFAGELVHAEHVARYLLAARLAPGRRVLDIACGEGYGSALLARAGARSVVGVDIDADTVAYARRRYGLDFREGDAKRLDLPDGSVDLIASFETIEHVAEPEAVLDELARLLAPGGLLLISTPNAGEYLEDNPFHIHEFTPEEFFGALRARFASIRPLYQQNLLLSAILDERGLAEDDLRQARPWELAKVAGVPVGRELYTLALCGAGDLPELAADLGVAASIFEAHELAKLVREWQARAETAERNERSWTERAETAERNEQSWRERAETAERLVTEWNARALEAERQNRELRETLDRIRASLSWRITRPLRALRGRERRLPPDSR
jgi:SAM-dependent methyltransferase